jgi:hypothetical protein
MSLEGANGAHIGTTFELFKRHKTLPHPREGETSELYSYIPASKPRDLDIDTETSSRASSDSSSPRTLKHASKRIGGPGLPPTPPTHSRKSSGNYHSITSAAKYDTSLKGLADPASVPSTPPNQKSPPTPDVTPPRNMPRLAFRPPPSDRYPSSRTESFKTARENPYSSDEDEVSTVRPILPSARPSENEIPQIPETNKKRKEIGLGLGLESDEGTTTPKPNVESRQEFVVFDGEWGSAGDEVSEVEREWDDNLMRNVTVRKRSARRTPIQNHIFPEGRADEVLEDDIVSPTNATRVVRSLPLQERIARRRLEKDAGKFGERIPWPIVVEAESPTPDVRRFSAMSGRSVTSTIIEAMVVDAPPLRQKTLRHSKKHLGLRDFSSDQSSKSSAPNSVVSSEQHHKLIHKRSHIPERRHRSLASNTTVSTTSSSNRSRREIISNGGIPVVVIPDRRSSSKSSKAPSLRSTSSRRTKRSMSLNSAPLSHSSKFNNPGYFDNLPHHKRTVSESTGSGHSVHTIDFPPVIPVRRSSLSAPTSRNTSRAGSLTTESLKTHNMIQQKAQELLRPEAVQSRPADSHGDSTQHSRLNVDHNGDPFFGNRLSAQVTPFSQTSYETAGTAAEVSEAMAISLYPHQNTSVLMVEQQASSSQVSPPTSKGSETSKPRISINDNATGPVTPPQPIHPMDEVDSPLRNPRAPPEPPAIKFIPPTPAVLTPSQEEDLQLGYAEGRPTTSDSIPKRGMSLVRRAFSNKRRNSEPVIQPGEGLLKRTFSLSSRRNESTQSSKGPANRPNFYPSVADRPADGSKLHPFWRPSHFWDDLEDRESLEDDEFSGYPIIDNRPQPPKRSLSGKLKRTFAILPITDDDFDHWKTQRKTVRRTPSGNMRVVRQRSQSLGRGESSSQQTYAEAESPEGRFGYGFKDGNRGKGHTIPGLGVRIEYAGWGGVRRKLSDKRRQQRSEKLRASISSPREVQSGVDDVLRRRFDA